MRMHFTDVAKGVFHDKEEAFIAETLEGPLQEMVPRRKTTDPENPNSSSEELKEYCRIFREHRAISRASRASLQAHSKKPKAGSSGTADQDALD